VKRWRFALHGQIAPCLSQKGWLQAKASAFAAKLQRHSMAFGKIGASREAGEKSKTK
jgi:hypothetical protein